MLRRLFAIIFSIVLSSSFLAVGWVSSKEGSADVVQADFYVTPIAGPPPLTVQFFNQSTGGDTCLWEFGDDSTSILQNPDPRKTLGFIMYSSINRI